MPSPEEPGSHRVHRETRDEKGLSEPGKRTGRAANGLLPATPSSSSLLPPQWTACVSVLTTSSAFQNLLHGLPSCLSCCLKMSPSLRVFNKRCSDSQRPAKAPCGLLPAIDLLSSGDMCLPAPVPFLVLLSHLVGHKGTERSRPGTQFGF